MKDHTRARKTSVGAARVVMISVISVVLVLSSGCGQGGDSTSQSTPTDIYVEEVGLYPVTTPGGRMGYIDKTGKLVIQAQFTEASSFSEGVAAVCTDVSGLWGYIDAAGQPVIPAQFADASAFSEGLAAVRIDVNGSWGFVDTTGALVIPPQFSAAFEFSDGLARVRTDKQSGYIDHSGEWVISMSDHDAVGEFSGGLALVFDRASNLYGYVDTDGDVVIPPTYADAWGFSEGLAAVRPSDSDKYGYIDRKGEWVIEPQFVDARPFSEGVAAVKSSSTVTWGYIDTTGVELVPGHWDLAEPFRDGIARVGLLVGGTDGATGALLWGYAYIGLDGETVWRDQAYAVFTAPGATTTTFAPDPVMPEVGGTPTTVLVP